MLRKTAAKAFGSGAGGAAPVAHTAHQTGRSEAVERVYSGLHDAFRAAMPEDAELGGAEDAPGSAGDEPEGDPRRSGRLTLGRLHPGPGGVELTLGGPGGTFTFLNSMTGYITVFEGASAEAGSQLELLGVQPQGGVFRPIRKPIDPGAPGSGPLASHRTPFRFTSVPEVAREYLVRARGTRSIQKVDTPGLLT